MTETEPKVSTVFSDLQRILFFFIIFALIVMLAVRATGSPSGIKATATETQSMIKLGTLIQSGYVVLSHEALREFQVSYKRLCARLAPRLGTKSVRNSDNLKLYTYQTIRTTTIITNMIEQMIQTKLRTSLSRVVNPVLGSFVNSAILPNTVSSPVATTTPVQTPDTQ